MTGIIEKLGKEVKEITTILCELWTNGYESPLMPQFHDKKTVIPQFPHYQSPVFLWHKKSLNALSLRCFKSIN